MFSRTRRSNGMRRPKASHRAIFSPRPGAASAAADCARPNQLRRVGFSMRSSLTNAIFLHGVLIQRYAESGLVRNVVQAVLHDEGLLHQIVFGGDRGIDGV